MNWALLIIFGLAVFLIYGAWFSPRRRRRAPNVLGEDGWPKPESRAGFRPNDEE